MTGGTARATGNVPCVDALNSIAAGAKRLRTPWRFDWPEQVTQTVERLRLNAAEGDLPVFAALMGGASSGKSTVFNNLLGGHVASQIGARSHTTLGPIVAVHESKRSLTEHLFDANVLLPPWDRAIVELDGNGIGETDTLWIVYHEEDELRDVFLFDMPDFTSEAARTEGDVGLSLLPWFDRLIVLIDHERWFDRQTISLLRRESSRFGQERFAMLNRTQEGSSSDEDDAWLQRQGERLGASDTLVLEFRRGRGFRLFPPNALASAYAFLRQPVKNRTCALIAQVAESANRVLNHNEERAARLSQLRESLEAAVSRALPTQRECMTSLMTHSERRHLDLVYRVLRIPAGKTWLSSQTQRWRSALRHVPVVGAIVGSDAYAEGVSADTDRVTLAGKYFQAIAKSIRRDVHRTVSASTFWDEMRRWGGQEPSEPPTADHVDTLEEVTAAARAFDATFRAWDAKVESECQGISPNVKAAIGIGAAGLAITLVAVEGPIAALTFGSAKIAIGAALTKLATVTGAGAVLGKPMGRLLDVVQDSLLGCPEFEAVKTESAAFHSQIDRFARHCANQAMVEAGRLVIPSDEPLLLSLEQIRDAVENAR